MVGQHETEWWVNIHRNIHLVSLENIVKHDRSVLKVADLPKGYHAIRKSRTDKWEVIKTEYNEDELKEFGYYCSQCGEFHEDIPMAYGSEGPLLYFLIPEDQREERCVITSDQCIIDEKHFYIRGCLELTVEDNNDCFQWNLWVEVSRPDYDRISEVWDDENRILEPPYDGEIATQLEPYPQTSGLTVKIITQKVGVAPKLELPESNHPLYFEQQSGIDMNRVTDFARKILYNHHAE
ncbi:MAG: DUF2199 domain-containing protein, partial [Bacteroidota bacterium]